MCSQPVIRMMDESDTETISAAFTAIGWQKPPTIYQRYIVEQEQADGSDFPRNGTVSSLAT